MHQKGASGDPAQLSAALARSFAQLRMPESTGLRLGASVLARAHAVDCARTILTSNPEATVQRGGQ